MHCAADPKGIEIETMRDGSCILYSNPAVGPKGVYIYDVINFER